MKKSIDFRDQISRNKRNSIFLILMVGIIVIILGWAISMAFSQEYFFIIMIIAIIISVGYTWFSFYNSHKIAIKSVKAKKADKHKYRDYYRLVESLTVASSLPMPKLYIMESDSINAFASGRDPKNAVICVTTGALENLERRELEGVLAHEMSHIANYDIRFITLVSVMVGMVAIISQIFLRSFWFRGRDNQGSAIFIVIGIALAILAPIAVMFIQLAISRKREFTADATAVKFTRNPRGLIKALEKIKEENKTPEKRVSKALAPLFFSNPLKGMGSTHPSLEKRIGILKRL